MRSGARVRRFRLDRLIPFAGRGESSPRGVSHGAPIENLSDEFGAAPQHGRVAAPPKLDFHGRG